MRPSTPSPSNPYAQLASLLDTTRALDPEEMAELHLEQGYVDRALEIYERLATENPRTFHYRQRRDWLRRLERPSAKARRRVSVDTTLRGMRAPGQITPAEPMAAPDVRLRRIIGVE